MGTDVTTSNPLDTLKRRSKALLEALILMYEGPAKFASELEVSRQLVSTWVNANGVPLKRVPGVAKKLRVNPVLLNYEKLPSLTGKSVPWEDAVNLYAFPQYVKTHLLNIK